MAEHYRGAHDTRVYTKRAGSPPPENRPGMPSYWTSYTVGPGRLCYRAGSVVQVFGPPERHCTSDGSVNSMFRKVKPFSEEAKKVAHPIVYRHGDDQKPFDLFLNLHFKNGSSSEAGSSRRSGEVVRVYNLSIVEHRKQRLYSTISSSSLVNCSSSGCFQLQPTLMIFDKRFWRKSKRNAFFRNENCSTLFYTTMRGSRMEHSTFQKNS